MSNNTIEITLHPDARIKGDKEKLTAAVLEIYRKHGALTPGLLIEAARPVDSPLHAEFTWDAAQALVERQREQALYLIRVISLEITEVDTGHIYQGREFVLRPSTKEEYISIRSALSDKEMREQMVERLKARLVSLQEELRNFEEFVEVVEAITEIMITKPKRRGRARSGSVLQAEA